MYFYTFVLTVLCTGIALADRNGTACDSGYWGDNCINICGECYIPPTENGLNLPTCNTVNGHCRNGCLGRWSGKRCDEPDCPQGCGPGQCLAPGYCGNCGDISIVSPNCEDIRLRGLLGSLISFIVIISAISFCGFGSVWYKRRKNTPVSL